MRNESQGLAGSLFKGYESAAEFDAERGSASMHRRALNGAWWTFASALMLASVSGSLWSFGEYSNSFKPPYAYNFSQTRLQSLAVFSTVGNFLILDSGVILSKFGTVAGLAYGCSWIFLGYLTLWICIAVVYVELPFAVIACCFIVIGHGCGSLDNALFTELMNCFPNQTGYVVGCLKGFYGLSPGFLTMLATIFFNFNPHNFVVFLSIYAGVIAITFIPVIHATRGVVKEASSRIHGKLMAVSLGIVVAALVIFSLAMAEMRPLYNRTILILILVCVFLGIGSLFSLALRPNSQAEEASEEMESSIVTVEATWKDMITSPEYFLMVMILTTGVGAGGMFASNAGQIVPAFYGSLHASADHVVPSFVTMLACLGSIGRLASGCVSEMLKSAVARPWFLVIFLGMQIVSFLMLIVIGRPALWIAGGLVSFTSGGMWTQCTLLVREIFGPSDFPIKFPFAVLSGVAGMLLFAFLITGNFFDQEAERRHEAPFCFAARCFNGAFALAALCDLLALMLAIVLCRWTAWIYKSKSDA